MDGLCGAISACSPSPSAEPAVLPPEEQVRTVSVERDGVAADCGKREQIGELLSILADMEPTNLQSVQDVPQADAYTSIHFEDTEGRVYTIFYYETDGTEYVEQSCQGIYKPAPALGELLDELLESGEPVLNDRIPMVMADGAMYYDTGRESTVTGRCGVMDGEITSAVERTEVPSENNQSNFGAGYGYQWGPEEGTWKYAWTANGWYLSGSTWTTIGFILREDGMIKADCRRIPSGGLRGIMV